MADPRKEMVRWFGDEDPDYLCSFCGERIKASEEEQPDLLEDDSAPIRVWKQREGLPTLEARFHHRCFNQCLELGIFAFHEQPPGGNTAA